MQTSGWPMTETIEIRLGRGFHRLMEFLDGWLSSSSAGGLAAHQAWTARLLAPFALTQAEQRQVCEAVLRVLGQPALRSLLVPDRVNLEILVETDCLGPAGDWLRPDRVLIDHQAQTVTVVDYKWRVLPSERAGYADQLRRYAEAMASRHCGYAIQSLVVDAQAGLWILQGDELVHC